MAIREIGGHQVLADLVSENCYQVRKKSGNFEWAQWWHSCELHVIIFCFRKKQDELCE